MVVVVVFLVAKLTVGCSPFSKVSVVNGGSHSFTLSARSLSLILSRIWVTSSAICELHMTIDMSCVVMYSNCLYQQSTNKTSAHYNSFFLTLQVTYSANLPNRYSALC